MMSSLRSRPALRWLVPAAAAVAIVGGGAAIGTFSASAEPSLPPRSAAQLLVDLQTARLDGLSGTVVQRANLGLPALPSLGGQGSANLASLVSGTHTLRVWYAGPDQARVALHGTLGETDVIRNGTDVWLWDSQQNQATHSRVPAGAEHRAPGPQDLPMTPQEAADKALAAIDPTTEVTVGRSATIAGHDAYELVLAPREPSSLVGQIRVAIDATKHVPLRFELFAKDTDEAAFEVAFTQVDFARPDTSQFAFNPPPGAKVTESRTDATEARPGNAPAPRLQAVGKGWTTVLVARTNTSAAAAGQGGDKAGVNADQLRALTNQFPAVSGDWGSGRLLSGKLFNVLLTDDGRVFAGTVSPERLYEVARSDR